MTKWVHRALTRAPQHVEAPSGASTPPPWHRRARTSRVDDRSLRAKVVASSVAEGTLTCRGAFGERRRGSPGCASAVVERCRGKVGIPRWGRRALQRALCAGERGSVPVAEGELAFLGGLTARCRGHVAQTRRGARRRRREGWHSWVGRSRVAEGTVRVRRGARWGRGGLFGMPGRSLGGTANLPLKNYFTTRRAPRAARCSMRPLRSPGRPDDVPWPAPHRDLRTQTPCTTAPGLPQPS